MWEKGVGGKTQTRTPEPNKWTMKEGDTQRRTGQSYAVNGIRHLSSTGVGKNLRARRDASEELKRLDGGRKNMKKI